MSKRIDSINEQEMYELWWQELVDKTVRLVVKWQCLGFVHGVLNTDNMSILGLTIDYGPYGFMEYFNEDFVPNYSDHDGRYSYKKQPEIFLWNLDQLAITLDDANLLKYDITKRYIAQEKYTQLFAKYYGETMRHKFGLNNVNDDEFTDIVQLFFDTLKKTCCDFTNSFRALNMISVNAIDNNGDIEMENNKLINYLVSQCCTPFQYGLLKNNHKSGQIISLQRSLPNLRKMADLLRNNPDMNSLAGLTLKDIQEVLDYFDTEQVKNEQKDDNKQTENKHVNEMSIREKQEHDRNAWQIFVKSYRNIVDKQGNYKNRIENMNWNNPKYILRNYILQNCINDAENGDYQEIEDLLQLIKNPYIEQTEFSNQDYDTPVQDWGVTDCVSCSS